MATKIKTLRTYLTMPNKMFHAAQVVAECEYEELAEKQRYSYFRTEKQYDSRLKSRNTAKSDMNSFMDRMAAWY